MLYSSFSQNVLTDKFIVFVQSISGMQEVFEVAMATEGVNTSTAVTVLLYILPEILNTRDLELSDWSVIVCLIAYDLVINHQILINHFFCLYVTLTVKSAMSILYKSYRCYKLERSLQSQLKR